VSCLCGTVVFKPLTHSQHPADIARRACTPHTYHVSYQLTWNSAAYFAGKGVDNKDQQASIAGAVAAAHYIRAIAPTYGIPVVLHTDHCAKKLLPWLDGMLDADEAYFKQHNEPLFSSHMIDLSEEEVEYNVQTTKAYLKRAAPMKQWLEMEIGITGGEEDGVNNEDVDNNSLYTQPEDILHIHKVSQLHWRCADSPLTEAGTLRGFPLLLHRCRIR
jgi:fructose-bisphosphate aldolase class II